MNIPELSLKLARAVEVSSSLFCLRIGPRASGRWRIRWYTARPAFAGLQKTNMFLIMREFLRLYPSKKEENVKAPGMRHAAVFPLYPGYLWVSCKPKKKHFETVVVLSTLSDKVFFLEDISSNV